MSAEVTDWITSYISKASENEQLFVHFVDPCLTSIHQAPNVVMNTSLKELIHRQHHDHVHRILQVDTRSSKFKPEDKITMPKETLIDFVEKAYDNVNSENIKT